MGLLRSAVAAVVNPSGLRIGCSPHAHHRVTLVNGVLFTDRGVLRNIKESQVQVERSPFLYNASFNDTGALKCRMSLNVLDLRTARTMREFEFSVSFGPLRFNNVD